MTVFQSLTKNIKNRLTHMPIVWQIVISNSIIIIIGAVGGTLTTRHLFNVAADVWLIVVFASIGTTMTIVMNGWLIRSALRPLRDLYQVINLVQSRMKRIDSDQGARASDPNLYQMADGINSLVVQLEEQNRMLRALSNRAITAQEEERKRIALSLHDDTGQALTMLIINLERLEAQIKPNNEDVIKHLVESRKLASQTLDELRKIIHGLRPTMLDDLGLVPAIRWYARSNLEEAGIRVDTGSIDDPGSLAPEIKISLYRIAQEAINNIVRHSSAKSATISLTSKPEQISLIIEDDGYGFDVEQVTEQALMKQQWGLLGISERAELVGGSVQISSRAGSGTHVEVVMPISKFRSVKYDDDSYPIS